jgi:hypothetical protein
LDVRKPKWLCNPVSINQSEIRNPNDHLVCYSVKRAKGEKKFKKVRKIHAADHFGSLKFDATKEREICLVSQVDATNAHLKAYGASKDEN